MSIDNPTKTMSRRQGFTLLELLVVIAIIVVLAVVSLVSLKTERRKARMTSVLKSLSTAKAAAMICMDGGGEMLGRTDIPAGNGSGQGLQAIYQGEPICNSLAGSALWPPLPANWRYPSGTNNPVLQWGGCRNIPTQTIKELDTSDGRFTFCAYSDTYDAATVICTEKGCRAEAAQP